MATENLTFPKQTQKAPSGFMEAIRNLAEVIFASPTAIVGLTVVLIWVFIAVCAPVITRYDPLSQDYMLIDKGPSSLHILGTDDLGRDVWSRVAYGARTILMLGPLSVLVAFICGIALGLPAGYYQGWMDEVVMRILDSFMAFPTILLYMIIISAVGASSINVVIAIAIGGAPGIARLVRALTMDIRTREYVSAAKLRGDPDILVMLREILPNCRGPLLWISCSASATRPSTSVRWGSSVWAFHHRRQIGAAWFKKDTAT